jgi:hypothetical protein
VNKFIAIAAAGVVAIAASVSMTAPSSAHFPGAGLAAGFVGFALGAAVANAADHDDYYRYDRGYGYRDHVEACEDAYRSYDPRTDTYTGYDGDAHACNL